MNAIESKERLLEILQPGQTVYCILRHVSKSGMTRYIDLYTIVNGEMVFIGMHAANVIHATYNQKQEGIKRTGCGMDMGFDTVYNLSYALFEDGYKLNHRWL